jgi:hypothetical protein
VRRIPGGWEGVHELQMFTAGGGTGVCTEGLELARKPPLNHSPVPRCLLLYHIFRGNFLVIDIIVYIYL